jgi:Zn-dependent peptidase ImmA (M78 family)
MNKSFEGNLEYLDTIPKVEKEAHLFALMLLIPKKQLIDLINKGGQTIGTLAEHFQMPLYRIREAIEFYGLYENK